VDKTEREADYESLDISSIRHFKGERAVQRNLKLGYYEKYVDMHRYEEPEHGGSLWTKDNMIYCVDKKSRHLDNKILDFDAEL
jgi:hypothetical protein